MVPPDPTPKSLTALALTDLESLLKRRPVQTTRGPSVGKLRVVVVTNQGAVRGAIMINLSLVNNHAYPHRHIPALTRSQRNYTKHDVSRRVRWNSKRSIAPEVDI